MDFKQFQPWHCSENCVYQIKVFLPFIIRDVTRTSIGGCIFIYSVVPHWFLLKFKSLSKEISRAQRNIWICTTHMRYYFILISSVRFPTPVIRLNFSHFKVLLKTKANLFFVNIDWRSPRLRVLHGEYANAVTTSLRHL